LGVAAQDIVGGIACGAEIGLLLPERGIQAPAGRDPILPWADTDLPDHAHL